MSALVQTSLIVLAIMVAYLWLQIPGLAPYALQAFALAIGGYLVSKRWSKAKLWHVAPTFNTTSLTNVEMPLVTFAFLVLIGATGNFGSYFFPLTFIHLFFLTLACSIPTTVAVTMGVVLFHYAMTPTLTSHDWSALVSIPVVTLFFLFAKSQYQIAQREEVLLEDESQALAWCRLEEAAAQEFIVSFLPAKISQLRALLEHPHDNRDAIAGQLTLLELEIQKVQTQTTQLQSETEELGEQQVANNVNYSAELETQPAPTL